MKRALAFVAVALLAGCDFFAPPPPDPSDDGLLSCDEVQPLDGLTSADELDIDAANAGLRIVTRFDAPGLAAVLRVDGDDVAEHLGSFVDGGTGEDVLTGTLEAGQRGKVELFAPGGGAMSGSLSLTCAAPEVCWNLIDDDGDGRVDCADPLCARVADCEDAQEPLETEQPGCSASFAPVDAPVLRAIDDQQTLYLTGPNQLEFWGGAEVVFDALPIDATEATLRVGGAGMLCIGTAGDGSVSCDRVVTLADGDEASWLPGEVAWLEPSAPVWESIEVQVDCEDAP